MQTSHIPTLDDLGTVLDAIEGAARWTPDKIAIICNDNRLSYSDFQSDIMRVATYLVRSGIKPGDRVGLLVQNRIEHLVLLFGIMRAQAVAVPISHFLSPETVRILLSDAYVKRLFVDKDSAHLVLQSNSGLPNEVEGVIGIETNHPTWESYADAIATIDDPDDLPRVNDVATDCNIIYSSGTTGRPKGIVHTHFSRREMAVGLRLMLDIGPRSNGLVTTPLCSNGSWMIFVTCLTAGGTVTIMPSFTAEAFLKTVEDERCTIAFVVPTQVRRVVESLALKTADLSSLDKLVSSGAPFAGDLKARAITDLPCDIVELYGQTEGFATMLDADIFAENDGSVGRPHPGADIVILGPEGEQLDRGDVGEIAGYSTSLMRGYNSSDLTPEEIWWVHPDGRRFMRSGDIGKIGKTGLVYILDRKKDMIISGGLNIFPKDIEDIIARHADICDVAVIGLEDPEWGEVPAAIIRLSDTSPSLSTTELMDWVNKRVGKTQRLKYLWLRNQDFPRNLLGKVLKRELRVEYGPLV